MDSKKKGEIVLVVGVFLVIGLFILFRSGSQLTGSVIGILPDLDENLENKSVIINETVVNESGDSVVEQNTHLSVPEQKNIELNPSLAKIEDNASLNDRVIGIENFEIQGAASATSCGTVTSNITLTSDVSSGGSCFNISANNIAINCVGRRITYASSGTGGYGINNSGGFGSIIIRNCIIVEGSGSGTSQHAIYLSNVNESFINNNTLITLGTSSHGIDMVGTSFNNTFLNNNINSTGVGSFEMLDETTNTYVNYLIYNNSFGRLEWLDNGTGSFLRNLTFNLTNNAGLTNNIIISNNSLAVNVSAFFPLRINSSVNITLRNISLSIINGIQQLNNFSAGYVDTSVNGINCTGCRTTGFADYGIRANQNNYYTTQFTYQNDWTFNTTSLGSFSLQGIIGCRTAIDNITLSGDVSVIGDRYFQEYGVCFDINTPNIVLDCQGHSITGNSSGLRTDTITDSPAIMTKGAALNSTASRTENVTIKNCVINGFLTDSAIISFGTPITIINTTIYNVTNAILGSSGSIEVINSTIYNVTLGISAWGTVLNITGNKIYATKTAMDFIPSANLFIKDNNFTNNNIVYSTDSRLTPANEGAFYGLTDVIFTNNYLAHNYIGYDLCAWDGSSIIKDRFVNNTIALLGNCSLSGILANSVGTLVQDSEFTNNTNDIVVTQFSTKFNLTFLNSSVNKSKMNITANAFIYVKWYVDVNVTDTSKVALNNATVTIEDAIGKKEINSTNTNGITRLIATEFYRSNNINYYVTPHTIKANKNNYTYNSTSINLIDHSTAGMAIVNLTLGVFSCGSIIYTNFDFGQNYNCMGDGIIIGANNIVINGNGFNLTGLATGMGINISGYINTSILNLYISNFIIGLYLENANNSNLSLLRLTNNTKGAILNNSQMNYLYDTNISNNTENLIVESDIFTNNSVVNITIDFDRVVVRENATLFKRWYVDANITFNGNQLLVGATVIGSVNGTTRRDDLAITQANGIARLKLTEFLLNSSGTYFLTPHNISTSFTYLGTISTNETTINLTQTNNTAVHLNIPLNCTTPNTNGMVITSNTTFCPGTYMMKNYRGYKNGSIVLEGDHLALRCVNTILQRTLQASDYLISAPGRTDISIIGCEFDLSNIISSGYYGSGIILTDTTTALLVNLTSGGIWCERSDFLTIRNTSTEFLLYRCDNALIEKNTITAGLTGIAISLLSDSSNNIIRNNSFQSLSTGINIRGGGVFGDGFTAPNNNSFYHNVFSSITNQNFLYSVEAGINNFFNTTVNGLTQGNEYSDYCDKGKDNNGDDYADTNSTPTAADWPYNATVAGSKIISSGGVFVDNGPRIITCPSSTVFLGSSSSSGGSSRPAAAAASAPSAPPSAETGGIRETPPPPPPSEETYSASETSEFLERQVTTQDFAEKNIRVTVILENTGTKKMLLFPEIFQKIGDPFFIVTRKTLGFEGSFFTKLSALSYSRDPVAGRLLKATIVNPEQIILNPGEKIEKVIEIDEGLPIPREIKIQFTTLGETVFEEDVTVTQKGFSGTALDIDKEHQYLDIYAVIVPGELTKQLEEYYAGSPTGAAIAQKKNFVGFAQQIIQKMTPETNQNQYQLELGLYEPGSSEAFFTDLYGPYQLQENQTFIFAQQLKYNPNIYNGNYQLRTKIYRGSSLLVKNQFDVNLGQEKRGMLWPWIAVQSALVLMGMVVYLMVRSSRKKLRKTME